MSQTVEFEYGIGETVEIVPLRYTDGGISKVLGIVQARSESARGIAYDVSYVCYSAAVGQQRRGMFHESQLAEIPPEEKLDRTLASDVPAPATRSPTTEPRIQWPGSISKCAPPESAPAPKVGDTVRVVALNSHHVSIDRIGTIEDVAPGTATQYKVAYEGSPGIVVRYWFYEGDLERVPSPEAPTPTFPRVIWQGQTSNGQQRVVETSPGSTESEGRSPRDAMGIVSWHHIPWDGSLAEAFAKVREAMESDGSNTGLP